MNTKRCNHCFNEFISASFPSFQDTQEAYSKASVISCFAGTFITAINVAPDVAIIKQMILRVDARHVEATVASLSTSPKRLKSHRST